MLSRLYSYVFDLTSIMHKHGVKEEYQMRAKAEKARQIKENLESVIKIDSPVREPFFYLLASLNTAETRELITILFNDEEKSTLESRMGELTKQYAVKFDFPSDETIRKKFQTLNAHYQYFDKECPPQIERDFVTFFKACKLIADFIECNNDENNEIAYLHAYKMLVLFGASHEKNQNFFKHIEQHLKQHVPSAGNPHPIHDALTNPIPINNPPIKDLAGWRRFIAKYGATGISYFQRAHAMESKLGDKAPSTPEKAEEAASQISYARAKEYPELATLCLKYHISEEVFNRCLEIDSKRKTKDVLPDVIIDGSSIGHPKYYLVKLPVDDPRAFILGKLTNCCQSIGEDSEQCVIDGITRETSAFYVLLKRSSKTNNPPFTPHKKINYDDFEIVGQGYAWHSKQGNITIDSWENLRPENDDPIAASMLAALGKAITESDKEIIRVTIGRGGKTPKKLRKQPATSPDKIAQGFQYGDSESQSLLYFNENNMKEKLQILLDKADGIDYPIACSVIELKNFLTQLRISGSKEIDFLEPVLLSKKFHAFWRSNNKSGETYWNDLILLLGQTDFNEVKMGLIRLIYIIHHCVTIEKSFELAQQINISKLSSSSDFIYCIELMFSANFLTEKHFNELNHPSIKNYSDIHASLAILINHQLLNDFTFNLILKWSNSDKSRICLNLLERENILTQKTLELLATVDRNSIDDVALAIAGLAKHGISIVEYGKYLITNTDRVRDILSTSKAQVFSRALIDLSDAGSLNQEIAKAILKEELVTSIHQIVSLLTSLPKDTLTPEFIAIVTKNSQYISTINEIIGICKKCNITLSTSNIVAILSQPTNIGFFKNNFQELADIRKLTQAQLDKLIANIEHAKLINDAIFQIKKYGEDKSLYVNIDLMLTYPAQTAIITKELGYYTGHSFSSCPAILSKDTINLLHHYPENIGRILNLMLLVATNKFPPSINIVIKLMLGESAELDADQVIEIYSDRVNAYRLMSLKAILPLQFSAINNDILANPFKYIKKVEDLKKILNMLPDEEQEKFIEQHDFYEPRKLSDLTRTAPDFFNCLSFLSGEGVSEYLAMMESDRLSGLITSVGGLSNFLSQAYDKRIEEEKLPLLLHKLLHNEHVKNGISNIDDVVILLRKISNKKLKIQFLFNFHPDTIMQIINNYRTRQPSPEDITGKLIPLLETRMMAYKAEGTIETLTKLGEKQPLSPLNQLKMAILKGSLLFSCVTYQFIAGNLFKKSATLGKKESDLIDKIYRYFDLVINFNMRSDESITGVIDEFAAQLEKIKSELSSSEIDDEVKELLSNSLVNVLDRLQELRQNFSIPQAKIPKSSI